MLNLTQNSYKIPLSNGVYVVGNINKPFFEIFCLEAGEIVVHLIGGGSFTWHANTLKNNYLNILVDKVIIRSGKFLFSAEYGENFSYSDETEKYWVDELNNLYIDENGNFFVLK